MNLSTLESASFSLEWRHRKTVLFQEEISVYYFKFWEELLAAGMGLLTS
jgi:hypothetical protein